MRKLHPHSKLIDMLGGTTVVADMFNITKSSVSFWRRNGIPVARMMYLEIKYKNIVLKFKKGLDNVQ